ncbi:MAG: hypothetical protein JO032_05920 [Alphaproteobacteria bacterium]|nr:hypothetical protein [Alphaproteobacteria bacterium]
MRRLLPPLFGALMLLPALALADDPQGQGCGLVSGALVSQGQGQVMINCVGVTEEFGAQLAGILTYVLQKHLDPEIVITKLDEVEGVPEGDKPRTLSVQQGQTIVQSLVGTKGQIAMAADPGGKDAGDYALAIATKLGMAGWQIQGGQIRRAVLPGLEDIHGLVLVVNNDKAPPEPAVQLKKAMAAAKIFLPMIGNPGVSEGDALLWVGKRASLNAATQ